MKKLFTLVCCFIAIGSFAQLRVGIQAGYNSSKFNVPGVDENQLVTSSVNGISAGILGDYQINKLFFAQAGLQIATKGSYVGRGQFALYGSNSTVKLTYLQLPVNVGVKIKVHNNLNAFAGVGLYAAYGLTGTQKGTGLDINGSTVIDAKVKFSTDVPSVSDNTTLYIKPFDFGYNATAGLEWKLLQLSANFSRGFQSAYAEGTTKYENQTFNVSLACFLFK
ncbi:porin family protein [Chitinophagaceae bacterium LWZ2-11]